MPGFYFSFRPGFSTETALIEVAESNFFFSLPWIYGRYVGICHPLRYTTIMNKTVCFCLPSACWVAGFIDPIPHMVFLSKLSFCGSHTINHFFCDGTALMMLTCTNTSNIDTLTYIIGAVVFVMSFFLIIISYIKIISVILKIQSAVGQRKAFSTCTAHITMVILFTGSLSSTYIRPTSAYSIKENKMLSLLYIVVTPLCNPIVYSLKNTEFKNVLQKKKNTAWVNIFGQQKICRLLFSFEIVCNDWGVLK
ncbi:olfactory receptor 5V1-like [Lissotriton helveticus]